MWPVAGSPTWAAISAPIRAARSPSPSSGDAALTTCSRPSGETTWTTSGSTQWFATYDAAFRASWRLHDDALELLDRLEQAGVRVGALSNSSRELSIDKLARLGLTERLPLLVSPDDLGFGKPDPRVFALACRAARHGAGPHGVRR